MLSINLDINVTTYKAVVLYLFVQDTRFSRFFSPKVKGAYYIHKNYMINFSGHRPNHLQDRMTKSKLYL